MPSPPDLKNRTWITAAHLQASAPPTPDVIDRPYASRWYYLEGLNAGDDVTVTLTMPQGATVDYTLLGFTDIRAVAEKILAQRATSGSLDADDMDSDDMDSDDMDSDDMDSDDMDSDDMDSDDMDSDDMDSDDMDSDDMDSDDMDSGDYNTYKDVYGSAQRHALRSASVTPGPADEQIHMTARAGGGKLYFRVRGHHGASDADLTFNITASVTAEKACAFANLRPRWTPPRRAGCLWRIIAMLLRRGSSRSTLILTHTGRPSLRIADRGAFMRMLKDLARVSNASVHDLAGDARLAELYKAWDQAPTCVPQANAVVESIRGYIADFEKANPLRYVVLVGGDDVVPFARIEDRAEISREWKWAGPYAANTPLGAALTYGFYLSDDPYGRSGVLDPRGKNMRAPTRAVGRLVESADDITAYVRWYLRNNGALAPFTTALVTGYAFVADLAGNIDQALRPAGVNVDTELVNDTWTSEQLSRKIWSPPNVAQAPDPSWRKSQLIAAQGHYSANTLVPAQQDGPKLRPNDAAIQNGDLSGVLWMTIGCHSAHDIVDPETRPAYHATSSWAETLLRRGATLIGGTGYQYGESELPENSERLYTYLAQEIASAKRVNLGAALIAAKDRYLRERVQIRGLDQKLIDVATLYGLPMLQVGVPQPQVQARAEVKPAPGRATPVGKRLATRTFSLEGYELAEQQLPSGNTYWTADANIIARPLRPVLPGVFRDITVPGMGVAGVLWTSGRYRDLDRTPVVTRPATEAAPRPPKYRTRALLPVRPFRVARGSGRQTMVFAPLQAQVDPSGGRSRLWENARFTIYYSDGRDATALQDAPALEDPRLVASGGGVDVSIDMRHYGSLTEDVHAYASYPIANELRTTELNGTHVSWGDGNGFVRRVSAHIDVAPGDLAVFFQAVGGNGRVSSVSNGGRLFTLPAGGVPRATRMRLQLTGGAAGYRDRIDVTATLTRDDNITPVTNADVLLRLGGSRLWARTDANGIARIAVNGTPQLPRLTVATRPRPSGYLVVASFPGTANEAPSAASQPLTVEKAKTDLRPAQQVLWTGVRLEVCQLVQVGRGGLGERPIKVAHEDEEYVAYTDPDGWLRLEPSDLGSPAPGFYGIDVTFEGDERYLDSHRQLNIEISSAPRTPEPHPSERDQSPRLAR